MYVALWLPSGSQQFWQPEAQGVSCHRGLRSGRLIMSAGSSDVLLWDADLKGFGVRCRPSRAKHYVLKLRVAGRQRWLTIGRHGSPWTPDSARREAVRLLGLRAAGQDPATERNRHKGAATVAEFRPVRA